MTNKAPFKLIIIGPNVTNEEINHIKNSCDLVLYSFNEEKVFSSVTDSVSAMSNIYLKTDISEPQERVLFIGCEPNNEFYNNFKKKPICIENIEEGLSLARIFLGIRPIIRER